MPRCGTCWRAAVGSSNNTFGIKGVVDFCFFFKSITNASELRRRMSECFERAALPHTSPKVHKAVGGLAVHGSLPQQMGKFCLLMETTSSHL